MDSVILHTAYFQSPRPRLLVLALSASSGVRQGSVLGLLLFLLLVNDLRDLLEGKILLFSDNVKIISPRSQYDDTERSLRTAWDWSVKWELPLNPDKCCHLPMGQPPIDPLTFADRAPGNGGVNGGP